MLVWHFLFQLIAAQEVPDLVFVDKLLADDSLRENVAVFARRLLDLDAFAFVEVHVAQEQASFADAVSAKDDDSMLLQFLSLGIFVLNSESADREIFWLESLLILEMLGLYLLLQQLSRIFGVILVFIRNPSIAFLRDEGAIDALEDLHFLVENLFWNNV